MKPIITIITILFISLLSSPSWSETMDDLVERDGLFYKKFTDIPFSGEITGLRNGRIKNGKEVEDDDDLEYSTFFHTLLIYSSYPNSL